MKIVVITGSPHKNGTSALLAGSSFWARAARGTRCSAFDAAFEKVAPCLGCGACRAAGRRACVYRDAMDGSTEAAGGGRRPPL